MRVAGDSLFLLLLCLEKEDKALNRKGRGYNTSGPEEEDRKVLQEGDAHAPGPRALAKLPRNL